MMISAVVWVVLLHHQHHRRALSCRGGLPGHSTWLVRVCRPCPPTYALRSLPKLRTLNRLTGAGSLNGLSMVQRQWFQCALQWINLSQLERIFWYDPIRIRSAACYGAVIGARSIDVLFIHRP